jgi:hypothetical protein
VCPECGDPVPDSYVKRHREKRKIEFNCPCGGTVSLAEPKDRIHLRSKVEAMEQSAARQRDFDAFVVSAKSETSTRNFQDWAGGERATLTILFPETTSPALYYRMKREILSLRDSGLVLIRLAELKQRMEMTLRGENFELAELEAVVSLLAGPAMIQRLGFGGFILLRPEVLTQTATTGLMARSSSRTTRAAPPGDTDCTDYHESSKPGWCKFVESVSARGHL